jgi:hypothetical protein
LLVVHVSVRHRQKFLSIDFCWQGANIRPFESIIDQGLRNLTFRKCGESVL